jgi:hypothetical protein
VINQLNDYDELTFALNSLRYAMGRRTTAPLDVSQAIRNHWHEFHPTTKSLVLRDLKYEIDRDDRMRELCLERIAIADGLAEVFPRAALSIVVGLRFAFALGDWDARSTWDDLYKVISEGFASDKN